MVLELKAKPNAIALMKPAHPNVAVGLRYWLLRLQSEITIIL